MRTQVTKWLPLEENEEFFQRTRQEIEKAGCKAAIQHQHFPGEGRLSALFRSLAPGECLAVCPACNANLEYTPDRRDCAPPKCPECGGQLNLYPMRE
jgi:hypothetical protein